MTSSSPAGYETPYETPYEVAYDGAAPPVECPELPDLWRRWEVFLSRFPDPSPAGAYRQCAQLSDWCEVWLKLGHWTEAAVAGSLIEPAFQLAAAPSALRPLHLLWSGLARGLSRQPQEAERRWREIETLPAATAPEAMVRRIARRWRENLAKARPESPRMDWYLLYWKEIHSVPGENQ